MEVNSIINSAFAKKNVYVRRYKKFSIRKKQRKTKKNVYVRRYKKFSIRKKQRKLKQKT